MSKQTDRRAAEREARKLAFQKLRQAQAAVANPTAEPAAAEATQQLDTPDSTVTAEPQISIASEPAPEPIQKPAISEAQLAANRANAQLSTGPVTEAGRAKSAQNAMKHGLTSKTVVLAGENAAEYKRLLALYIETYAPATEEELRLTQSLLDSTWRINRLTRIESAIFLKGEIEFANRYEDRMVFERENLIHAEVYLKYEKSIRNLNIQEARLRRAMEKDLAELQHLQTTRRRTERIAAEEAAKHPHPEPPAAPNGFDFSTQPARTQTAHTTLRHAKNAA